MTGAMSQYQPSYCGNSTITFPEEQRIFHIGDDSYLAVPLSLNPDIGLPKDRISPITVISGALQDTFNLTWVKNQVDKWLNSDDVFRVEFLEGVVFITSGGEKIDTCNISDSLHASWGTNWCVSVPAEDLGVEIDSAPYVTWNGKLCKVFRLYDDPQNAFILATKPHTSPGSYENLRISGKFYSSLSVAVPSRISSRDHSESPLAGLRFAVKDIFAIKGLRTTAGCRAWYDLSQPSSESASALQKLVDAGANLVGTLKLGSLITREEPTESVDYHAAFNPRGDGFQSAWSSSGGSGAAIAAYDWLDFTLGTDTTGSSRRPALANGCFQIRLSQGALELDGVVPSWTEFDAPAMFTRDITKMEKWVGVWTSSEPRSYTRLPMSVLYLKDFLPVAEPVQMELINSFISDLEATFGIEKEELSIADVWEQNPPAEADNTDIREYLKDVGVNSFCYGVYHELDQFREEYRAKYSKEPYVNPVMRWRWEAAQNVTKEQYEDAVQRLRVYKDWFLKKILQVGRHHTLVVLPITKQEPDYRDIPPGPPTAPGAFDGIWLAPTLGAPEISLPIGEMEYFSRISQRTENLPIVVSLLGEPGFDMQLIDAARRTLENSGKSLSVATGSRITGEAKNLGDA